MMTAITEVTRNASTASRGLNMISSRLVQVLDDSSSTGKKLTKIYEDLGIALKDNEGQLRSTYDILKDLASQWNTLSGDQQKYIALTSAGARQTQNFVALMENFDTAINATATAYNSAGSAARENERVMDSIAKKIEILRSEFQQLVIGEGGLQEVAKNFIDLGIAFLRFVNSDMGKMTLWITSFGLLAAGLQNLYTWILQAGRGLVTYALMANGASASNALAVASTMGFSDAVKVLTTSFIENAIAWAMTPMGMATIAIASIIGIAAAIGHFNTTLSESTENLKELSQNFKDAQSEVEGLTSELESIQDQLKQLEKKKINVSDPQELTQLRAEKTELEEQEKIINRKLALAKQELEIARQLAEIEAKRNLKSKTGSEFNVAGGYGTGSKAKVTAQQELELAIEKHKELTEALENLRKEQEAYANSGENDAKKVKEYEDKISNLEEQLAKVDARGVEMANTLQQDADALTSTDESTQQLKSSVEASIDAWQEATGYQEEAAEQIQATEEEIEEETDEIENLDEILNSLCQTLGITSTELDGLLDAFSGNEEALVEYLTTLAQTRQKIADTSTVIDNLQEALDTASSALEEYNKNGYLTIDTFQSLMGISAQYLAALVDENGQLEVNQQTLSDLIDTLKIAKIEELAEAAAAEINALRNKEAETASKNAETAVDAAGEAFRRAGDKAAKGAAGIEIFNAAMERAGIESTHGEQEKEIEDRYKAIVEELSSWSVNVTKAGNASSSAGKKASSAAKELNKELEETKKKYETIIKWISSQYDAEIDKIKKAKDEALKAEEAKIKAKEKEKDAALDAIEKEIQALEKQKKALKEQKEALDDRKQALKDEEDILVKSIEKNIKALEKERDALIKPVEERIKVLEKERDAIIDSTQTEIDALQELKEERQTYWDEQINALKEANKELKDNLELQEKLDALEKAKNTKVKVYKEGQGFVYDVDQNAVQQAQKALDEYLSEKAYEDELARLENLKSAEIKSYDDRINELTKYKDNTKKIYDQQINDLKEYKESVKENYDEQIEALKAYKETVQEEFEAQIELINQDIDALEKHMDELDKHKESLEEHKDAIEAAYEAEIAELEAHKQAVEDAYETEIQTWEKYKQEFENMVEAYEKEQNKLLFEQLTGIKSENSNWMTRLDNLAKFVNEYNKLQQRLETGDTNVQNTAQFSNGTSNINTSNPSSAGTTSGNGSLNSIPIGVKTPSKPKYDNRGFRLNYASGISSISNDQIGIVGENPNQELVIGSKLNGQAMMLNKGTGIVNADSTKTLASILNQVGKFGASGFGSGNGTLNNNYNNDSLVINGVTIQGANIKDPQTFVNSLLNLKAEALQRAYKHR